MKERETADQRFDITKKLPVKLKGHSTEQKL